MKYICIFGSNKSLAQREDIISLGKLLAQKSYVIVNGGFGGTMEDVACGAKSVGGKTIGVTYYKSSKREGKGPNKYIDKEIETDSIFERIAKMIELSDAFVVLEGSTGTLLELAAVLEHINKGMMDVKPVICLGEYWKEAINTISDEFIRKRVKFAKTVSQILEFL